MLWCIYSKNMNSKWVTLKRLNKQFAVSNHTEERMKLFWLPKVLSIESSGSAQSNLVSLCSLGVAFNLLLSLFLTLQEPQTQLSWRSAESTATLEAAKEGMKSSCCVTKCKKVWLYRCTECVVVSRWVNYCTETHTHTHTLRAFYI